MAEEAALFQCGSCQRTYTRLEHLSRHIRTHTQERNHICEICSKAFGRLDLLKRHYLIHQPSDAQGRSKRRKTASGPHRARQACSACTRLHLKCSDDKPCQRCTAKDLVCDVGPFLDDANGDSTVEVDLSMSPDNGQDKASSMRYNSFPDDEHLAPPSNGLGRAAGDQSILPGDHFGLDGIPRAPPPHNNLDWLDSSRLEMLMMPRGQLPADPDAFMPQLHASGFQTPRGGVSFGFQNDLEFTDMDFSSLHDYSMNMPFDYGSVTDSQQPGYDASSPETLDSRTAAYARSELRFRPQAGCGLVEANGDNLVLSDGGPVQADAGARLPFQTDAKAGLLNQSDRDRVLALIFANKPSARLLSRGVFPSLDLLNKLLQYYVTSHDFAGGSWLHFASLGPNDAKPPELLTAMIAAGAVRTPDDALRKLGFAMQESLRLAIPEIWEKDNSRTRDLTTLQAYLMHLEIGIWSGSSRRMELAESFLLPVTTMMRRSGYFRKASYLPIQLLPGDTEAMTHEKWKSWIAQESCRRLVFRLFAHDAQVSMLLWVPPLVALSEVAISLPCPDILWIAPNASAWRSAALAMGHSCLSFNVSVIDCLNDIKLMETSSTQFDVTRARFTFLYCLWGIVWSSRQIMVTLRGQMAQGLPSRMEELSRLIHHFRLTSLGPSTNENNDLEILVELISMHLHVPFDTINAYAGVEGSAEILLAFPLVQEWAKTSEARQAICHAGQIVARSRSVVKGGLHGCRATALYHASLCLWAYGVAHYVPGGSVMGPHGSSIAQTGSDIYLDELETLDTQKFVAVSHGVPRLGRDSAALMEDPGLVIEAASSILLANFPIADGPAPPLTQNLMQLMDALRASTRTS